MSVSVIFGSRLVVVSQTCSFPPSSRGGGALVKAMPQLRVGGGGCGLVIESSSRPQKKATAHHRKTRPKKTQPWDIKRGSTVYPPLPELPSEWTLVTDTEETSTSVVAVAQKGEMSVSAIFGSRLVVVSQTCSFPPSSRGGGAPVKAMPQLRVDGGGCGLVIESSSRPQKKATAHHRKIRPKKTQPWDIKRGPTVYPPLPELPPEWTLVTDTEETSTSVVVG